MQAYIELKVISVTKETKDAVTIQLAPVDGKTLEYKAGQFLTFIFEKRGKEIRRSFSLSSSPTVDQVLAITVKRIPNGEISSYIYYHLKAGDTIKVLQPNGRFYIDQSTGKRDIFMIAAGSGITPVYSIIKESLYKDSGSRIILIYSNRNEKSTIFYNELNTLEQKYPNQLKCLYIFSEPDNKDHLYKGHLGLELLQKLVEENLKYDKGNTVFMLCGPFDYMRNAEMILIAMGFDKAQVHKENFVVIAEQEAINTPPAQEPGDKTVSIHYNDQLFDLIVPVGKPILKAALEKGIHLPYSCQGGICGTCSAICSSGKIAMSINDVLTPKELEKGWILTCVGYPVSENSEIGYS